MSRKPRKHASHKPPAQGAASTAPFVVPETPRGGARATVCVCSVLFLAVLLVFGQTVRFDFVGYDDPGVVSQNPMVAKGLTAQGLVWALSHAEISLWVPLTTLSHMFASQVFGLWAGGHHLVNVLLHGAASVLLFLVLRRMTGSFWRCAFVAALFALHPLRAESVAWITERKDVFSGLFFMLTLGAYHRWSRQQRGSRWWVPAFLILGLLSKPMLITVPVVLLLLDHWPLQRTISTRFSRLLAEKAPLFVVAVVFGIVQLVVAQNAIEKLGSSPLSTRVANAIVSCATYVIQVFWPANLAVGYPFPWAGVDLLALIGASALLLAISATAYHWRRQAPWLAIGWLWYLVMMTPVLGFIQASDLARADRYTYLPHIGLYIMAAWTAGVWCAGHRRRPAIAGALAIAVVLAAGILAFRQTGFWKDSETLWHRALACMPNNDMAHFHLGATRLNEGKLDEAIDHFQKTLEANPQYVEAHINLGRVFLEKGLPDEALSHYWKALDIRPRYAEVHYNLALVYAAKGEGDEVLSRYRKALEINPSHFDSLNNLGSLFLQSSRIDDAITFYRKALRVDPKSARALNNLATALAQKGRIAEAIQHYERVLDVDPDHTKALNSAAWLLATSSDPSIRNAPKAISFAERASQLTGDNTPFILRTLAAAYADASRFEDALKTAERALDLATAQNNDSLSRSLPGDIVLYKSSQPLRQKLE